jgi:hypothetical protein
MKMKRIALQMGKRNLRGKSLLQATQVFVL